MANVQVNMKDSLRYFYFFLLASLKHVRLFKSIILRLLFELCVGSAFCCCDKISEINQLKGERIYFAS